MTSALLTLLLALPQSTATPAAEGAGISIDRTVRLTRIDWLGRRREIHRKETLTIQGGRFSITDHTFGEKLVILTGEKRVRKADVLAGVYSELTFDQIADVRNRVLAGVQDAKARVPGTPGEKELESLLQAYGRFAALPRAELRIRGARREVILNGDRVRLSVEVDPSRPAPPGLFEGLIMIGAFHPEVASKLKDLGGLPVRGTLRYVLFLDRVIERFEVTAVRTGEVPASAFALPEGLKKIPLKGFGPAPERKPAKPAKFERSFREDELDKRDSPLNQDPDDR